MQPRRTHPTRAAVGSAILAAGLATAALSHAAAATAATAVVPAKTALVLSTGQQLTRQTADEYTGHGFPHETIVSSDHELVVPGYAIPEIGSRLDPSLFDAPTLAADGYAASQTRIPVQVSYVPGSTPAPIPGLTLTASGSGYISSRAAFGKALASQFRRELVSDGTAPLFGDVRDIAFAGRESWSGAPRAGAPALHTLRLVAKGFTGVGYLAQLDSQATLDAPVQFLNGVAQVAVFPGHYELTMVRALPLGNSYEIVCTGAGATVLVGSAATVTVNVNMTSLSSPVRMNTGFKATVSGQQQDFYMLSQDKGFGFAQLFDGFAVPFVLTPQAPVKVGQVGFSYDETATPVSSPNTVYNLEGAWNGLPAKPVYTATKSNLAVVTTRLHGGGQGSFTGTASSITPIGPLSANGVNETVSLPGKVTEYYSAGSPMFLMASSPGVDSGLLIGTPVFSGGKSYTIDMLKGPITAGFPIRADSCLACASGNLFAVRVLPLIDSSGDAAEYPPGGSSATLTIAQGGKTLVSTSEFVAGAQVRLGAGPITLSYDQALPGVTQSAISDTTWVFADPATGPDWQLPAMDCAFFTGAIGTCQEPPVLSLGYDLDVNGSNDGKTGTQHLTLTVGHVLAGGVGSAAPVRHVAVMVSFDGGKTWTAATVAAGKTGVYPVTWQNPASSVGTSPWLRISAADVDGNSITQTIAAAYTVAGP